MPKNKTQVVNPPSGQENQEEHRQPNEPLSGSKSVKNRIRNSEGESDGHG